MEENFNFPLVGADKQPFLGYVSSTDPTLASPRNLVQGSKNVYKTRAGGIEVRPGKKLRGERNATAQGIRSEFVWETSNGMTLPLRVLKTTVAGNDGALQLEVSDPTVPSGLSWVNILTGLSLTRFVFDTVWDEVQQKDVLLMVNGDVTLKTWSGGSATLLSTDIVNNSILTINSSPINQGTGGYVVGDILTLVGGDGTAQVTVVAAALGNVLTVSGPTGSRGSGYAATTTYATTGGGGTGCTVQVLTVGQTATLTKTGPETWAEAGFETETSASKILIINGNEYDYFNGEGTTTLQGILPITIINEPLGSRIFQKVISIANLPVDNYVSDFLKVAGNQVYVGSYGSRVVYSSADSYAKGVPGYLNFVNTGSHVVGDPDIMIFDDQIRGIGSKDDRLAIFAGIDILYLVTPNTIPNISYTGTDNGTRFAYNAVDKLPLSARSGAISHEQIGNFGSYLVWLDQTNQLRALGTFTDNLENQPVYLSLPVWDEFVDEDFTDGELTVTDDTIYLTAPNTTRVWIYQNREIIDDFGRITAEKIWYPPQEWDLSRVNVLDGLVYGYSASNPQTYQLWDTNQYYDDTPHADAAAPYKAQARFGYLRDKRTNIITFDKVFTEGYILENAPLNLDVVYNYEGSTKIKSGALQSADKAMYLFQGSKEGVIGGDEIGSAEIGGMEGTEFPKFRVISDLSPVNCFEAYLNFWSHDAGSRWQILAYGADISQSAQLPTFIRRSLS